MNKYEVVFIRMVGYHYWISLRNSIVNNGLKPCFCNSGLGNSVCSCDDPNYKWFMKTVEKRNLDLEDLKKITLL